MSEFGLPPNTNLGGFGRLPEPTPRPPRRPAPPAARRAPFGFKLLLIAACIAAGALLSWGLTQQRERARLSVRNRDLGQAYTVVIAQRDDLAHFVADPRVRMSRLAGRGAATGRQATVAWNGERGTGLLLAEGMPLLADGQVYRVWRGGGSAWAATDRTFGAEAGLTCVEFHAALGAASGEQFIVAVEAPTRGATPERPALPAVYEPASAAAVPSLSTGPAS